MNFEFYTAGKIIFKTGAVNEIGNAVNGLGNKFLIVSGGPFLRENGTIENICSQIEDIGCSWVVFEGVFQEPDPETITAAVELARAEGCDAVISVGGGSAIDTGKATAGLITNEGDIVDYLEGVGRGLTVINQPAPFIAVPTTSGTGSEVTKNAVITSIERRFKKSFRSEKLIANVAIVDPSLVISLPKNQTAASGMDALTQLIESYVSSKAQPIPSALALYGMELAARSLKRCYDAGSDVKAREDMAMASLLSGICLANSGLGAAHGIGAALGCYYGIPHGIACAILLPHVISLNMSVKLREFAQIGCILTGVDEGDDKKNAMAGLKWVENLSKHMDIPNDLKSYEIPKSDIEGLVSASKGNSMRGNPVQLNDEELAAFIERLI